MSGFESNLGNTSLNYGPSSRRAGRRKNEGSSTDKLRRSCPPVPSQQQKRESNAAFCPGLSEVMQGMELTDEFGNVVAGPSKSHLMPALDEDEEESGFEEFECYKSSTMKSRDYNESGSGSSNLRRHGSTGSGGSPNRKHDNRKHESDRRNRNGGSSEGSSSPSLGNEYDQSSPVTPMDGAKRKVALDKDLPLPFSRDKRTSSRNRQKSGGSLRHSMPVQRSASLDYSKNSPEHSHHSRRSGDYSNNSPEHSSRSRRATIERMGSDVSTNSRGKSSCMKYLRHYVESLRLPPGAISEVIKCYESIDSRKWLIENSSSMKTKDALRVRIDSKMDYIKSDDNVTRWDEFAQCFDFHLKMSVRCWMPTEFWLVNDPGSDEGPQRFSVACGRKEDLSKEREIANEIIERVQLNRSRNPLASQMRRIEKRIAKIAPRLMLEKKQVIVTLCTGGEPTDETGNGGVAVMQEFVDCLVSLTKLPVKIIIRLCTDNEKVTDFFNRLDSKLDDIEVLDDFFGEAMEVYLHNPWLTYAFGLHRLREAGIATDLMCELDERCFTIEDIHQFCKEFITGEDVDLPHPSNWDAFITSLGNILSKEQEQWNPVKKKQTAWIDIKKLEEMFGRRRQQTSSSYPTTGVGRKEDCSVRSSPTKSDPFENKNNSIHSSNKSNNSMTLEQVIKRWSHEPPNFKSLNPLQDLLVNMPTIFPPHNIKVEPHEYFQKWNDLSREAFTGDDDEVNAVLKRAVRRSKLFLHPDKLPQDLTENQTFLFKTIWDVMQEQEQKTLK